MSDTSGLKTADGNQAALEVSLLTKRIRLEAQRLGFFKTGIVPARPLPMSDRLDAWLHSGMYGDMTYMQRQAAKRKDPGLVLENARTIIVLTLNYFSGHHPLEDLRKGKISRYAWGSDYHEILRDRLDAIQRFLKAEVPDAPTLGYADTGPIAEKVWGAQSSIGWMGKHSNLITREQGSWFFVAVILTTAVLEYDPPGKEYCGTCNRCITACPTRAIVAPYVVDARLCISYLTIEHKGSIPRSLRPLMGNHIFGCDDCQEVCPWNRFAVATTEDGFQPRQGHQIPDLVPLVRISREDFNRRFKNTPIRRTGRDRFVRNVAVALGNSHATDSIPALEAALKDESGLVRAHAAWALGEIGPIEPSNALAVALAKEADPEVREEIALALNRHQESLTR